MQLRRFILDGAASLEALYPPEEARSLVLRLCEGLLGVPTHMYVTEPLLEIPDSGLAGLEAALGRLQAGEPLQYVLGWQEFYGRRLRVSPSVLIPRPETELLVEWVLKQQVATAPRLRTPGEFEGERPLNDKMCRGPRILDLCTGSGCIAWTLALEVPGAHVVGVDISEAALAVARGQFPEAVGNGALPPEFVKADVLAVPEEFPGAPFDMITANPPYVRESEKAAMHRNVLEHEPELALFVPDADPLVFYRAIAQWALRFLKDGGAGIAEINEALGGATAEVFRAAGLKNVAVLSDLSGRDRFVTFCK